MSLKTDSSLDEELKDDFEYQNQGKSYDPIAKYK